MVFLLFILFIFIINIILHINEDTLANIIDKFNSQFSNKIESIPDNFWEGFFNSFNDSPVVDLKVIAEASPGVDLVVIKEKMLVKLERDRLLIKAETLGKQL